MSSVNDQKWLCRAIETAKLSSQRFKHGAIIVKSGNVLALAANRFRNTPGLVGVNEASWHAEVAALRQVSLKASINSVLYVARFGNCGTPALSRPCDGCMDYIRERGVKKIVFSTGPNTFAIERV